MENLKVLVRGRNASFWFDRWLSSSLLSARAQAQVWSYASKDLGVPSTPLALENKSFELVSLCKEIIHHSLIGSCRGNLRNKGGGGIIRDTNGMVKEAFSTHYRDGTNNGAELKAIVDGI
ncbi:hypothetical protein QYF36_010944 [Acer negundo]|nr:hypothetical protein QYF36_010944 [Acer negundo]